MKMQLVLSVLIFLLVAGSVHAQSSIVPISGTSILLSMAKYDPIPAEVDKLMTVWFDVTNRGTEAAQNLTITLVPKYPFSLPDNSPSQAIEFLSGLTSKRIEYKILIDKNAPDGTSEIEVKYNLANNVEGSKKFNITVNNTIYIADLKALYVSSKPAAYPGSVSTISIDIVNADKGSAYYVIAHAESPVASIERNKIFIGTLEPNDFDNVDYELKVEENIAPGTYPINLTFYYRDKDSHPIIQNDIIEFSVVSSTDGQELPPQQPPYMTVVYLVAALIVIRLLIPFGKWFIKPFRRRKKSGEPHGRAS